MAELVHMYGTPNPQAMECDRAVITHMVGPKQCEEHLAHNYVLMLDMIVEHFFVDGAQHICQAWGACHPYKTAGQPRE